MTSAESPASEPAIPAPASTPPAWNETLTSQLVGVFLWVAFFDQIPQETLGRSPLGWPVAGAALGGLAAFLFLYLAPAMWAHRSRRPLADLSARAFGASGSRWLTMLVLGATQPLWVALSIRCSIDLTARAFQLWKIFDPSYLQTQPLGPLRFPGYLTFLTGAYWFFITGIAGRFLPGVIVALMRVYNIAVGVLIGVTAVVAFRGLPGYTYEALGDPRAAGLAVLFVTVQFVFAYATTVSLLAADWTATLPTARETRLQGVVGMAFAPWVVLTLVLLTAAGAGTTAAGPGDGTAPRYLAAAEAILGAPIAGLFFLGYALAVLSPACFATRVFVDRMNTVFPAVTMTNWMWTGMVLSLLLLCTPWLDRVLDIVTLAGAVLAPVAAVLTAESLLSWSTWPGPRRGLNLPAAAAWLVGAAIGIVPLTGRLAKLPPASLLAWLAAFVVYLALSAVGLRSATVETSE